MEVVQINKRLADRWVSAKHYSRRLPVFWAGFGLVVDGRIEGVAVYGQPMPPVLKHAFRERDFRLWELCRVVVQTNKKNAASFLVANSLARLPRPCAVVSYADSSWGHCGIIYQATNWIYTGATVSHDHLYIIDGVRTHPMTLRDHGITNPREWARKNNIKTVKPEPKHRYVFLLGSRKEKADMLSSLNYPVIYTYPKSGYQRYDDGPAINTPALEALL